MICAFAGTFACFEEVTAAMRSRSITTVISGCAGRPVESITVTCWIASGCVQANAARKTPEKKNRMRVATLTFISQNELPAHSRWCS